MPSPKKTVKTAPYAKLNKEASKKKTKRPVKKKQRGQ